LKKILIFVSFLFISFASLCDLKISSYTNKDKVKLGENFTYTLSFEGLSSPIKQPDLPKIENGVVKGQYQTVEPAKNGFLYLYHYIIAPSKVGTSFLEDFQLKIESKAILVKGFNVSVEEGEEKIVPIENEKKVDEPVEISLEGRVQKGECYEGEAILYSLHLLTRDSVRNFEFVEKPNFDGFRKIEIASSQYPKTNKVERKGKYFLDVVVYSAVLVPLKAGTIEIGAFTADTKVQPSHSTSSKIIRLKGGDLKIKVISLPVSSMIFQGAIGHFQAVLKEYPENSIKVNEVFSTKIRISGIGNLPQEPFEIPKSPFFATYPIKIDDRSKITQEGVIVDKDITLNFAPLVTGKRSPGKIDFVYFDTDKKRYESLTIELPLINVIEGTTNTKLMERKEILPILDLKKENKIQSSESIPKMYSFYLLLPFFITFLSYGSVFLLERFFLSEEKVKLRILKKNLEKEFKKAKICVDSRKSKEFHTHLRKALESFIEIKIEEPVSFLTTEKIEEKLKEKNFPENQSEKIVSLIREIDSAEFTDTKIQKNELKKRLNQFKEISKGKRGKTKALSLLLFILSFSLFCQESIDILGSKAKESYLKGDYSQALKYYKMVEDSGFASPELYYDIANCYFETGKIPYSIYYYKKALKVKLDFDYANKNLQVAKDLLKSKITTYEPSPLIKFLLQSNPKQFFLISLILLVLGNLLLSILIIFEFSGISSLLKKVSVTLIILGILSGLVFYGGVIFKESYKEGVILENVDVFIAADPSSKNIKTLSEGSEVFVTEISSRWVKIRWGEGEGYADSSKVGIP
jgi:tetratricopeptide (TPR) repeat protein